MHGPRIHQDLTGSPSDLERKELTCARRSSSRSRSSASQLRAIAAVGPALAGDGSLPPELQEVHVAVAKYHSCEQAKRDGYTFANEPCVASPDGTMGIHAINAALLADNALDADRPEVLLYVPKANGKLELVGVEYWKADADQSLGTNADPPRSSVVRSRGRCRDTTRSTTTCTSGWPRRPSGVFALYNPALSC